MMDPDDYCLCTDPDEPEPDHTGAQPDSTRRIWLCAVLCLLLWALAAAAIYQVGVRAGRAQMTAEYSVEIRRLRVATKPEQVRDWLKHGK